MLDTYMNAFDLSFLSIYRINGQELSLLPGFLAQNPPKKTARGRDQDRLLVYMTLGGNVGYSTSEYDQIVAQVSETFYSTSGSLTFALKTAVESLNNYLVERNMKSTGKGLYTIGALVLGNLRGNLLYIVQAGPTHVYHLSSEVRHLYDPQLAGKGLGLGQTARMYFSQITVSSADRLLLCASLPPNWDKSINDTRGSSSLETTRRRLLAIADTNVSAMLVQAADGRGVLTMLNAVQDSPVIAVSTIVPSLDPVPGAQVGSVSIMDDLEPIFKLGSSDAVAMQGKKTDSVGSVQPVSDEPQNDLITNAVTVEPGNDGQNHAEDSVVVTIEPDEQSELVESRLKTPAPRRMLAPKIVIKPEVRAQSLQVVRNAALHMAQSIQNGRVLVQKSQGLIQKAVVRLLPDVDEQEYPGQSVSRNWALFLAVAIPIIFLVMARIVYYQLGYDAQFKTYYSRAQESAIQAQSETVPTALRVEWHTTLDWLDKADLYLSKPNPESQALRQQAQTALDNLNKVVRMDYSPAFATPFGKSVQIMRMSASETDIYMLDLPTGSVLRGVFNGRNFDLDNKFQCRPGIYDGVQVDQLKDIFALPRSSMTDITVVGIDAAGKILYCVPDQEPHAAVLKAPGTGWQGITSISYDNYKLYVLDAAAHAVWMYGGDDQMVFGEPKFFFGTQVPVMLEQAIGIAVNVDDLYILYQDGHMTICTLSRIDTSPTRCSDPALYIDTRPGYQGGMKLNDGIFSQIFFTTPPDPSVALLEPFTQSIFRFSPRALELQNQILATAGKANPLPKGVSATAMAFSPNKVLFIFIGGQLYFSNSAP